MDSSPSFHVSSVFFTDRLPSLALINYDSPCPELVAESEDEVEFVAADEVEFVAADEDQELISMMATLGLPTTFGEVHQEG